MRREDLLQKFLLSEDIYISTKEETREKFDIYNSIDCISRFHNSLKGKKNYTIGLISEAGRIRSEQKILLRRVIEFSSEVSIDLSELIKYSRECIEYISDEEFISLIERAYKNSEITLGKVYPNIENRDDKIFVCDVSKIRFGMVEDDLIKLLRRTAHKKLENDRTDMIEEFLLKEDLSDISRRYIKSTLAFPTNILVYISNCYLRDFKDEEKIRENILKIKERYSVF
ncbi:hypothetical protein [uncultured Clostridium sp.]|uniref:hypothetical protein n=1 Tax=uncultured Clostridium sp. TaxID=59620 RepID=UPI002634631B|nr:hypothetical protein [uncultured Clostridium sp.]